MRAVETYKDLIRAKIIEGAEKRFSNSFRCAGEEATVPVHTCLPLIMQRGQKPDAAVVLPVGVDPLLLQKMGVSPGAAFCVTPTAPYLLPRDQLGSYPHSTWAGLVYAREHLKVRDILIFGSNDCLLADDRQFDGVARVGAERIKAQVAAFLNEHSASEAEKTELLARRVLVESAGNIVDAFAANPPERVLAAFIERDGAIDMLAAHEDIAATYAHMKQRANFARDALYPAPASPVSVLFHSCADSRQQGQGFWPDGINQDDVLFSDSIAAIVAGEEQSLGGVVYPWKLVAHARRRGAGFHVVMGHEGCGGAQALVRKILFGAVFPPEIEHWIGLAREPAEQMLTHYAIDPRKQPTNAAIADLANRVARAVTVWGARNLAAQADKPVAMPFYAGLDGSVYELDSADLTGQTQTILFQAPHNVESICAHHVCARARLLEAPSSPVTVSAVLGREGRVPS